MFFKMSSRPNPATGERDVYSRLVESFRNADDRVCPAVTMPAPQLSQSNPQQSIHCFIIWRKLLLLFSKFYSGKLLRHIADEK